MRYRLLGHSGLSVSEVSFGCMSLGKDHSKNETLLRSAFDNGINFFDTADLYDKGFNEETIGNALQGIRKEVVIATKVGNEWRADGSGWDWNPSKDYILGAIDKSLQRLGTDYIDLYQLHGGTIDDQIDETIAAFDALAKSGKIRYYGISSIRPNVIREYVSRSNITSVMMQYSLLDRRPEETCLDLLQQNRIGVLARGSVAKGYLLGKEAMDYLGHSAAEVAAVAEAVLGCANSRHSPLNTCLGYVLNSPAVTTATLGIRTTAQLNAAIMAARADWPQPAVIAKLSHASRAQQYEIHR